MVDGLARKTMIHISEKSHLNLTFNLCQCGMLDFEEHGEFPDDAMDVFLVYYVNTGYGVLETDGFLFDLEQGQGFFIFPDQKYQIRNLRDTPLELVWVMFTGYQVEQYLGRSGVYRTTPLFQDADGQKGELINQLHEQSTRFPNRYCKMMATMYALFAHMIDTSPMQQPDRYVDSANYYAMKARDYIARNFDHDLSVEQIAEAIGTSRKSLYSVFNYAFQTSPKQYLICFRIEKACQRLKSTGQSINEIARSVGYSNQFYFAKEFKRLTGMSPSEYRKKGELREIYSYQSFASTLGNDNPMPDFTYARMEKFQKNNIIHADGKLEEH